MRKKVIESQFIISKQTRELWFLPDLPYRNNGASKMHFNDLFTYFPRTRVLGLTV